ncbi:glycerol-3-phosphate acyltransferase [Conexibacter sp. SYSU D00693]|uniref:glycerol-3-phosphate acyltransferase n=1 Tax=Conexibacter sp. SYSU D00693 TaxID=2812560 RepID=UPI00196A62ED|nr:glycerol-3-phosphate acyltransferase [Conexibacter sp. SYSU D00693]
MPAALWVARRHGVDLRQTADGNPGAWNALEQLGARRAWPAFVGDGLKGTLAGVAGWLLTGDAYGAYTGVGAAMVGHALPLFARFRGGKAVMTFAGGMFAAAAVPALLALALCLLVTAVTRSFARGAQAGVFGVVPLQLALQPVERVAATGALMCLIGALFLWRSASRRG